MIVQIYEIQSSIEAQVMIELGVDHIGSVLLSTDHIKDIDILKTVRQVQSAGRQSSLIPLFDDLDAISLAVEYYQPDILHLCETLPANPAECNETDAILKRQRSIKERFPELELMRSIPIGRKGQGDAVPSLEFGTLFEPWSDWFLTDTLLSCDDVAKDQDQPVAGYVGITGQTCDWEIAKRLVRQSRIPVILAGGIGPDNVAEGISRVSPAGIDSCTLTNAVDAKGSPQRFRKDPEKVRKMIEKAHEAEDHIPNGD